MMKNLTIILKLILIAIFQPFRVLKKFSFEKIYVLAKALKYESGQQIITNFRQFLTGNQAKDIKRPKFNKDQFILQKLKILENFLSSKSKIIFPFSKPELSIVIILYNKAELTLACIQSILNSHYKNYEVIIVDNNSTDQTNELLNRITGAKIILNNENLHFLKASNQALPWARGEYLLFLNNDTEIEADTLDMALNTIKTIPETGAVGGKIILPGGELQEAGSIIWSNGSCLGYGRLDDPAKPQYNFSRITDYCSGAFLLTKTELFKSHGGFDTLFTPAYYEETDYCLWLQEKGLNVIYNHRAIIHHFEFGSGISEKAIMLQQNHQQIFFQKHKNQLEKHANPDFTKILTARYAASQYHKRKVLYIDDRVPHRDFGSGFPRSNHIVNQIYELGFEVTVYPLNFPNEDSWEVSYRDIHPFIEIMLGYGLDQFPQFIEERSKYYDVVWVSRPHNMQALLNYIKPLSQTTKIIYDAEAIFAERDIIRMKLSGLQIDKSAEKKMIEDEIALSSIADIVSTVSEKDAFTFKNLTGKKTVTLGHVMDVKSSGKSFDERNGLLFIGNLDDDASPNVDSVLWFVNEIFPLIQRQLPQIRIDIVGSAKSTRINSLNSAGVTIHGRVDDLNPFYHSRRVFIAPTRFAAGIPYKIHEAAANGIPVATTQLLCRQLGWQHNAQIIASSGDPMEFANNVVDLYKNKELWIKIKKNALMFIENEMSMNAYKEKISEMLTLRS